MSFRRFGLVLVGASLAVALVGCPDEPIHPTTTSSSGSGMGGDTSSSSGSSMNPDDLQPPPSGEGVQFATPDITVAAGDEIQNCYFFQVKDLEAMGGIDAAKPLNLHEVQIAQKAGSHHMNIFRVRTVVGLDPTAGPSLGKNGMGECFKSSNWADWPLVANTQQDGTLDWTFPDGVANKLDPDEWLMLQTHYVNATTQATPEGGKVVVNFWHLPDDKVTAEMGTIFATQQSIRVCQSNPNPTFTKSCQIDSPDPVHVIGANGHFHSRGKEFSIYAWDGTSITTPPESDRFYDSKSWNEPPMAHSPELDTTIPANGGVLYTCEFQWTMPDPSIGCQGLNDFDKTKYMTPDNQLDCCYTFGPTVEKNEHCNAFVYYYPKQDNVSCF
jgi:hypothetical protein